MTDTSRDGPERIALIPSDGWSWATWPIVHQDDAIEYIRADALASERDALQARVAELEARNRDLCLDVIAADGQAAEAYAAQQKLEAENKRLLQIIEVMDRVSPRADKTCNEPGITLSEAVKREYGI